MEKTSTDTDEFVAFAARLADAARGETLPRFRAGSTIVNKAQAGFDPVTEADREAERVQRLLISATFPDHGIVGEEFGAEKADAEWRWVLDPVDGTRAFVCGAASWATLIALERHQRPIIGVIDQPYMNERWIGARERTVFRRGETQTVCKTSDVRELSLARVSTTDPRGTGYFSPAEADAFGAVASSARVARFSLDAYAYGLLALGELDLVIEAALQRHDFAALVPVIEGAGGVITNWRGQAPGEDDRGRIIAAATPELHEEALKLLRDV